jgi:exonuclease III
VSHYDTTINGSSNDTTLYPTINIAGFNCRGLLSKLDTLLLSASLPHNAWHIICLQETYEAAYFTQQNLLLRHGWKHYSSRYIGNDNTDNLLHPRRGTAIYVSEPMTQQWNIVQHKTNTDLVTWITMTSNHKRLHVLSVYAIDVSKPLPDRKLAYDIVTEILNGMSEVMMYAFKVTSMPVYYPLTTTPLY